MGVALAFFAAAIFPAAIVTAPTVGADALSACFPSGDTLPEGAQPHWYDRMPQPSHADVKVSNHTVEGAGNVQIAVRVARPATSDDVTVPTVLHFSPYIAGRKLAQEAGVVDAPENGCHEPFYLRRGYAFVTASMRGTDDSGGCMDWGGRLDQEDGAAIVDWIAGNRWSNGAVGMVGGSFEAVAQFAAAANAPRALKAIIPSSPSSLYEGYRPGATRAEPAYRAILPLFVDVFYGTVPSSHLAGESWGDSATNIACYPTFNERINQLDGTRDAFWQQRYIPYLIRNMKAAVLTAVGMPMDVTLGYAEQWSALERTGLPRAAFSGPWGHEYPTIAFDNNGQLHYKRPAPEDKPEDKALPWFYVELRWLEHWLQGNDTGVLAEPAVTAFDQNGNADRRTSLRGGGTRILRPAAGGLSTMAKFGATTYRDSVPNALRRTVWQTPELRALYRTEPLAAPMRLAGQPVLTLHAALDVVDTDFAAVLYDVAPDGTRHAISRGFLDARHRDDLEAPGVDVIPEVAVPYELPLSYVEHTLAKDHRLALTVAGADIAGVVTVEPYGIESDVAQRATVTIAEGPGLTVLRLPVRT